jgi:deazaflavin-dependent oxidoreductase (nitroreductase family)
MTGEAEEPGTAERFLYLTTTGRTSGLPRDIEIWFVEHAGRHYVVSQLREASHWMKNLRSDPRVRFSVGTRAAPEEALAAAPGRARVVSDAGEPELARAVRAQMDAKYRWSDGLVVELSREAEG